MCFIYHLCPLDAKLGRSYRNCLSVALMKPSQLMFQGGKAHGVWSYQAFKVGILDMIEAVLVADIERSIDPSLYSPTAILCKYV